MAQEVVPGIPNPIEVTKHLTDETWLKPDNWWFVAGMIFFGLGCCLLVFLIIRWAASQQDRIDAAQKTATAYEYLAKSLLSGLENIEDSIKTLQETVNKIWDEILKMSARRRS
jgi:predicted negative regulator of RcsB-dependent stress response